MNERFIRVYQKFDINQIKNHLIIYGDLSASCAHCNEVDLKFYTLKCPKCQADFKYIGFRNVRHHLPKLEKIIAQNPGMIIIDFDDFKHVSGALKAQEFLK